MEAINPLTTIAAPILPYLKDVPLPQLFDASPRWRRKLIAGLTLLLIAFLAFGANVAFTLVFDTDDVVEPLQSLIFPLATLILWVSGIWLLTSREPATRSPRGPAIGLRTAACVIGTAAAASLTSGALTYFGKPTWGSVLTEAEPGVVILAGLIIHVPLVMLCLQRLAQRLPGSAFQTACDIGVAAGTLSGGTLFTLATALVLSAWLGGLAALGVAAVILFLPLIHALLCEAATLLLLTALLLTTLIRLIAIGKGRGQMRAFPVQSVP